MSIAIVAIASQRVHADYEIAEAKRRNLEHIILHASAMAMPMYEKFGWRRTSEMSITLPVQP